MEDGTKAETTDSTNVETVEAKAPETVATNKATKQTVTLVITGYKHYSTPRVVMVGNREVTKVGAIITAPSKSNPSPTGVFEINQKQFERIATDCVKVVSPMVLGLAIDASAGQAKLKVDLEFNKVGASWNNERTGESGTYGFELDKDGKLVRKADAKDWINQSNHSIVLPANVVNQFNAIAFTEAVKSSMFATPVAAPVAKTVTEEAPQIA